MTTEIKVPALPESVADAIVSTWHVQPGNAVSKGDTIVDLETDKVVLEVPAPTDGILKEILQEEGAIVTADVVLGTFEAGGAPAAKAESKEAETPISEASAQNFSAAETSDEPVDVDGLSPAVRRLLAENNLTGKTVKGSGKNGRVTVDDIKAYLAGGQSNAGEAKISAPVGERTEKHVPMTRLRARIAERLLNAKNSTAMLTTFNEVNLKAVMEMRAEYKDAFFEKHGVKLGFMSFFTRAVVEALKEFPDVNASIDGNNVVYHGYFDVGIAVSTDRGLVVPVLRDVDQMSLANIESQIAQYAKKARDGKLTLEEMTGGNFTITNGGVFGSLLSTPILNPPQSAILGMHTIQERPVVENGQIVIRPMMYLALSYDHRIIDGKTSVSFLVKLKELLEKPGARLLLNL